MIYGTVSYYFTHCNVRVHLSEFYSTYAFFFWWFILEGNSPLAKSPLDPFLFMSLPPGVVVQDASLPVLTLLRILHAISRYWGTLYPAVSYKPLLSLHVSMEFFYSSLSFFTRNLRVRTYASTMTIL